MNYPLLKSTGLNEQSYLASVLNNPSLIDSQENYCTSELAKDLFNVIQSLHGSGLEVTTHSIVSEGHKKNPEITEQLIDSLRKIDFSSKDFAYYSRRLREDSIKVKLQGTTIKKAIALATAKGDIDLKEYKAVQEELEESIRQLEAKDGRIYTLAEMGAWYEEELERRAKGGGYLPTGDSYLDSHLHGGGAPKGSVNLIYGRSGVGKSIYALHIVIRQIHKQLPCIYYTPEMGMDATLDRLMGAKSVLTSSQLGNIHNAELQEIDYMIDIIKNHNKRLSRINSFRFCPVSDVSLAEMRSDVKEFKKKRGYESVTVVADLLTMFKDFTATKKSTPDTYEDAMNLAHRNMRAESSALWGVVQAKRPNDKVQINELEDTNKLRPTIEMLKNSAALEERSRIVLGVHRYLTFAEKALGSQNPEVLASSDVMSVNILKQNLGALSRLYYFFNAEKSKLTKWDDEVYDYY